MEAFVACLPDSFPVLRRVEVQLGDFSGFDQERANPPPDLVRSAERQLERVYAGFERVGVKFVEMA